MTFGKIKSIEYSSIRNLEIYKWGEEKPKLNLSDLNLFIGKNGSGKSTIIDLIDCLCKKENFYNIFRSNYYSNNSEINIVLEDLNSNKIEFKNHKKDNDNIKRIEIRYIDAIENDIKIQEYFDLEIFTPDKNIDERIENIFSTLRVIDIKYMISSNELKINIEDLLKTLNNLREHMTGLNIDILEPFIKSKKDSTIMIALNNSQSLYNEVDIKNIPSGWISMANTISFINNIKNSIILLEEPEVHLHPTFQRVLMEKIFNNIDNNKNQIFIATHSSVFINSLNSFKSSKIFFAQGNRLEELNEDANKLIDDLGMKASDIFQTNGIIWIEGPSDRIYINNWLKRWCKINKKICPIENVDYSFSMYCGSSLKHYTESISNIENDFINILKINKNNIILMDRDNDYTYSGTNGFDLLNKTAKENIREEFINDPNTYVWLTEQYTIESYLEENFIYKYFEFTPDKSSTNTGIKLNKFENTSNKSKIDIAKEYRTYNYSISKDVSNHIKNIYTLIRNWNS